MSDKITLHKIEETIIRHRLEEASMLADMTGRILKAIPTLAGPANGLGSAVDQRASEALILAETIRRNSREYLRPVVEMSERVNSDHTEKVKEAKETQDA